MDDLLLEPVSIIGIVAVLTMCALSIIVSLLSRRESPITELVALIRSWLVPVGAVLFYMIVVRAVPPQNTGLRVIETLFWIGAIWIVTELVRILFFARPADTTWRARVPGLFVDLLRVGVILIGAALVIALVWQGNLSGALATLGVGSIVIGLALQDTLGNLFAGIALLFERPFQVGDWVKVGDTIGRVLEINWRAVRIQPRSLDLVTVPNLVISKDRIHNFSRPTPVHAVENELGFGYQDPPNKVKEVLRAAALQTTDVLPEGVVIRTVRFSDSSVLYNARFFIERYDRLPDIQEEFMTHVWYAARRHGLTIPFPIRTVYRSELPPTVPHNSHLDAQKLVKTVPLFSPLTSTELEKIAEECFFHDYGSQERIVTQGQRGDTMYIISTGSVAVSIGTPNAQTPPLATLNAGDFFGEMALLTGEPRAAHVTAITDVVLLVVPKQALQLILSARPEVAAEIATIVQNRRLGLSAATFQTLNPSQVAAEGSPSTPSSDMIAKIRKFFGV